MIHLRNFAPEDAKLLQRTQCPDLSLQEVEHLICEWNQKQLNGKYFEMFAVLLDGNPVGTVSLYQHTTEAISIGPEIFQAYRRKGYAKQAMICALHIAREKGYKIVFQQIRVDNAASIALHASLGFETSGLVYTNAKDNPVAVYLKSLV